MRLIAIGIILAFMLSSPAYAGCPNKILDPYPNGVFASKMLAFSPGYWINTRDPLTAGFKRIREKKRLHPSRVLYPERRVLGCPKPTMDLSLTLGHEGYVVVSPGDCFRTGEGPDILIHEPRTEYNVNERINIYVTPDKRGKGPWYQVSRNQAVNIKNNYLELDLDGVVNERGIPVTEFMWVKIEDANSQIVMSNERFSGFEVSAVKFMHQCRVPIS